AYARDVEGLSLTGWLRDCDFSPDGEHILTVALPSCALWTAADGVCIRVLECRAAPRHYLRRGCFSPDGTRVAATSPTESVVWRWCDGHYPEHVVEHG